jgi:ABC-2 type transport system ATP-binding protein
MRLPTDVARDALAALTTGPAFGALDDFTLATPTLEDVYLALGGHERDLERQ